MTANRALCTEALLRAHQTAQERAQRAAAIHRHVPSQMHTHHTQRAALQHVHRGVGERQLMRGRHNTASRARFM